LFNGQIEKFRLGAIDECASFGNGCRSSKAKAGEKAEEN
jgi:hypothetical protein